MSECIDKAGTKEHPRWTCSTSGVGKDADAEESCLVGAVIVGRFVVRWDSGLDKGTEIEGGARGSPVCVGENTKVDRVEEALGTGVRDDNDGTVAVGNNSQRTLPTLTGFEPLPRPFLRQDGFREREGEREGAGDSGVGLLFCSSRGEEFVRCVIPGIGSTNISACGLKMDYAIMRARTMHSMPLK